MAILFRNINSGETDPTIKLNSMFAIKCIADNCDYATMAFIEAYIFPIVKEIAMTDLNLEEKSRGAKFF